MDEQLEFILDRVTRKERDGDVYREKAESWVKMWKLDPGFVLPLKDALTKGHEQVVLPIPYNVVNLSQRLLSSTPRIDVIPQDLTDQESDENAGQTEKWLTAMWKAVNRQQRRNVVADLIWYALVYGRFALEVKWVKDNLPTLRKKRDFPITIRALRPTDVGTEMGPYGVEFAYHKYEAPIMEVLRRWPNLKESDPTTQLGRLVEQVRRDGNKTEDQRVCVVDYWAMDPEDGAIWNAVLVEDEYAKEYKVTTYPDIPIIVGRGDYAVGLGEEYDGLSILHGIDGLWQYQCRLASQMATGLYWYFWPQFLISNENNLPVEDFEPRPGGIDQVPPGTKVDQVTMNPNVPLAQAVYDTLNTFVQQSTYPDVMFGQAPADLKTGYSVALLSDAAQGRIKNFQEGIQQGLEYAHSLVLCLVDKKGGTKGVDIYGVDEVSNEKYRLNLNKKMIGGSYDNEVNITPAIPTDDLQKVVQGMQLNEKGHISSQHLRDKYLGIKAPTDETRRIALEEAMQSDEMRPYRLRKALEDSFGPDGALQVIWEAGPQAQEMLMPPATEGYEWFLDPNGKVAMRPLPPPSPPMEQPGGLPEDPMAQAGGSPGMMPQGGAMPPGGPPLQPDAMLSGPMGGGIPPWMQGQIEGENLGLPNDADPLLMNLALNQPLTPEEEMMLAADLPQEGPI